jgi:hypothetical protein
VSLAPRRRRLSESEGHGGFGLSGLAERVYFDMRTYLEWKQGQSVSAVGDVAAAAIAAS